MIAPVFYGGDAAKGAFFVPAPPEPVLRVLARPVVEDGTIPPLREIMDACCDAKVKTGLSKSYIKGLRAYYRSFLGWAGLVTLDQIDSELVEKFVSRPKADGQPMSARTVLSNRGRFGSLFRYAIRRGYISNNPVMQLEPIRVVEKVPEILTFEQVKTLLGYCEKRKPVTLAYITLTLFLGLRPFEARKITWGNIAADCSTVTIDAAASKVRRRRIVEVPPNVRQWILKARGEFCKLPISHMTCRRYLEAFRNVLRLEAWPQDCLRHTAASYMVAANPNLFAVAAQLGHGVKMLLSNYRSLVTKEDCAAFWELRPTMQVGSMDHEHTLLDVQELAAALKVSDRFVYQLQQAGLDMPGGVRGVKSGKTTLAAAKQFLRDNPRVGNSLGKFGAVAIRSIEPQYQIS